MGLIKDIISPQTRKWKEFYRNRFQHDKMAQDRRQTFVES